RRDELDVGAERAEEIDLLRRLIARHDDRAAMTAREGHEREPDPGIARGALDDHAAWRKRTGLLGRVDDRERRAVFDAAAGVQVLRLGEDGATGGVRQARNADERRVADRPRKAVANV